MNSSFHKLHSEEYSLKDNKIKSFNYKVCVLCQEKSSESLVDPNKTISVDSYKLLEEILIEFKRVQCLPEKLQFLFELESSISEILKVNNAVWHKTCRSRISKDTLKRKEHLLGNASKKLRLSIRNTSCPEAEVCLFCDKPGIDLRKISTLELSEKIMKLATKLSDILLVSKIASLGDMVALKTKYHFQCLVNLYNQERALSRQLNTKVDIEENDKWKVSVAFAELCYFIENEGIGLLMPLKELINLYEKRCVELNVSENVPALNKTRFKEKLLAHIPSLIESKNKTEIILTLKDVVCSAIIETCDYDSEVKLLMEAAKILRKSLFIPNPQDLTSQEQSVPENMVRFLNFLLDGPNIKSEGTGTSQKTLTIAQLIKFNCVNKKSSTTGSDRHNVSQETPIVKYIGNLLHAETKNKTIISKLHHLGICIGYPRIMQISTDSANSVCAIYNTNKVVCPPHLPRWQFVTAAFDNIDHNPSSTTAKGSFHGTAISIHTHPSNIDQFNEKPHCVISHTQNKKLEDLPNRYVSIEPRGLVTEKLKANPVLYNIEEKEETSKKYYTEALCEERLWIESVRESIEQELSPDVTLSKNYSWPAYHADRLKMKEIFPGKTGLLPLFTEVSHSPAMVAHSMKMVIDATTFLNPGQVSVIACDQPLYALSMQLKFAYPNEFGDNNIIVMMGGLHIEMAALKAIGHWLDGSEWNEVLVDANIATSGTAQSFLQGVHVTKCRHALQVTLAVLDILRTKSFENDFSDHTDIEMWTVEKCKTNIQFCYWNNTITFIQSLLLFVRSIREGNFDLYIAALDTLLPWLFAMDRTHYSRWLSVHVHDMKNIFHSNEHVFMEFKAGKFAINKTFNSFSTIALDQAHEQLNALIKGKARKNLSIYKKHLLTGNGGAIGITDNPAALLRWTLAGPETSRSIQEFEDTNFQNSNSNCNRFHHEQTTATQTRFLIEVKELLNVFEDLGNPFEEEDGLLLTNLKSKTIFDSPAVNSVRTAYACGKEQYETFVKERLVTSHKMISEAIKQNNFPLMKEKPKRHISALAKKMNMLKQNVEIFSKMYIATLNRNGDVDEFFRFENQQFPPSLSDSGQLRGNKKSDLLVSLEKLNHSIGVHPTNCSAIILDGGTLIHLLKPKESAKTFDDYFMSSIVPFINSKNEKFERIDFVWDRYLPMSLKSFTREKRGSGTRQRVEGHLKLPKNWNNFLKVDENKEELFLFLGKKIKTLPSNIQVLSTLKECVVFAGPVPIKMEQISPCDHEEADSRIFVHLKHAAMCGHRKIIIRTVDTDIVVLAISCISKLNIDELWIEFGSGKHFRYVVGK